MTVDTRVSPERVVGASGFRRLFLIWQDPESRRFSPVGALVEEGNGEFVFRYVRRAQDLEGFRTLRAFPDLRAEYRFRGLPPFFENRVMSSRRPEYGDLVQALRLPIDEATPIEVLSRTGGGRATDTFHLVAEPRPSDDGSLTTLFLAHGIRYLPGAEDRVAGLSAGQALALRPEPDNQYNRRALLLDASDNAPVGYVPDWMLEYVHALRDHDPALRVTVEQVNGPELPHHLRLLCRLEANPPTGYRPFEGEDFEFI